MEVTKIEQKNGQYILKKFFYAGKENVQPMKIHNFSV